MTVEGPIRDRTNRTQQMTHPSGTRSDHAVQAVRGGDTAGAEAISVTAVRTTVILPRTVRTAAAREPAERPSWSSPVVTHADGRIEVRAR